MKKLRRCGFPKVSEETISRKREASTVSNVAKESSKMRPLDLTR